MATELAIQANIPNEQIPSVYHRFKRVFSDKDSQRFPESCPWDHTIDLLPDAPQTLNCQIYPLPQGQQQELDKFIDKHLKKGSTIKIVLMLSHSFSSKTKIESHT